MTARDWTAGLFCAALVGLPGCVVGYEGDLTPHQATVFLDLHRERIEALEERVERLEYPRTSTTPTLLSVRYGVSGQSRAPFECCVDGKCERAQRAWGQRTGVYFLSMRTGAERRGVSCRAAESATVSISSWSRW